MKKIELNLEDYQKVKKELSIKDFLLLYLKFLNKLNYIPILYHNLMEYHDSLKALEILQYVKITDDCVVYDSEAVFNVECFELRSKADEIFASKNINYEELAEAMRAIFPAKIRGGGGKLVKSPTMAVIDKLKKFFKFYPNVTVEQVIKATTNYIDNRRRANWGFITQLDYFIFKDNVSMLATEIESLEEEDDLDWTKNIV